MKNGDTKPVWHVLGPGTPWQNEAWWCFDSSEEAEAQAARVNRAQVSSGRAIYTTVPSVLDEGAFSFWAVKRPERIGAQ